MKGVVFSFKRRGARVRRVKLPKPADVRAFIRRYGAATGFSAAFSAGLVLGALYAVGADNRFIASLDFLFVTNLDARLDQGAIATFCACFASDFVFLSAVFLMALSPWGIPVLPFVSAFKGFGTGLTAAYLVDSHSFGGVGFYLLVLLPGTFLFCLALVRLSAQAVGLSLQMFLHTVGRADPERSLKSCAAGFCAKAVSALIMTFCAALLDTALWCLLSGLFEL